MSPPIGTYMRPVSTFPMCYCYRLDRVTEPEKGAWDNAARTRFQFTRFGLDRQRMEPVDDGRLSTSWLTDLVEVAPGIWREANDWRTGPWDIEPMYWREMGQRGQLELFAS